MMMPKRCLVMASLVLVILVGASSPVAAEPLPFPRLELGLTPADGPQEVVLSLQLLFLLTVLSLAPALLILTTSFTRIVIEIGRASCRERV